MIALHPVGRTVTDEPEPRLPAGVRLVPLGDERERVLREAWPGPVGYADMATPQPIEIELDEWLRDEATLTAGSSPPIEEEGVLVGYAGLLERPGAVTAEHGLPVVRRDRRGRGIGRVLEGTFVALEGDEIVGPPACASTRTVVRRRSMCSQRCVATAGGSESRRRSSARGSGGRRANGVHELVTWTQRGNEGMQALNRKLGCVDRAQTLTLQGPLP